MSFLSYKTAFLLAVTSVCRMGELSVLSCDSPSTTLNADNVVLRPNLDFLTKMFSEFHLSHNICLPMLFLSPNSTLEQRLHIRCQIGISFLFWKR